MILSTARDKERLRVVENSVRAVPYLMKEEQWKKIKMAETVFEKMMT